MTRLPLIAAFLSLTACGGSGGSAHHQAHAVTAPSPFAGAYTAHVIASGGEYAADFHFGDLGSVEISTGGYLNGWEGAHALSIQLEEMEPTWSRGLLQDAAGHPEQLDVMPLASNPGWLLVTLMTPPGGQIGSITWWLSPIVEAG